MSMTKIEEYKEGAGIRAQRRDVAGPSLGPGPKFLSFCSASLAQASLNPAELCIFHIVFLYFQYFFVFLLCIPGSSISQPRRPVHLSNCISTFRNCFQRVFQFRCIFSLAILDFHLCGDEIILTSASVLCASLKHRPSIFCLTYNPHLTSELY